MCGGKPYKDIRFSSENFVAALQYQSYPNQQILHSSLIYCSMKLCFKDTISNELTVLCCLFPPRYGLKPNDQILAEEKHKEL